MVRFFMLLLSAVWLWSCRTVKTSPIARTDADSTIVYLRAGEGLFLNEEQFNVYFDHVEEDSRCPEGVHCIWAGVAVVDLTVTGTYTRPQHIRLATAAVPQKGYQSTALFNGYVLRILALDPYPSAARSKNNSEKKRVTISVVKPR